MDKEHWHQIKECVGEGLELPLSERERYVESLPEEVREEVRVLLSVPTARVEGLEEARIDPQSVWMPALRSGDRLGHFEIETFLDKGGMAAVYRARDLRNGRLVALKILYPASRHRKRSEEEILASLSHPGIATFFESGETEGGDIYVVLEYVEGMPIDHYCERQSLPIEERLRLFLLVIDAVAYAHRKTVVHRDLKPANILVTEDGKPKLLDFGIAKLLSKDENLTLRAERPFTLRFASPEQVGGKPTLPASDIYSLGVLLSVLLTGALPYPEDSDRLEWHIQNGEPLKPSVLIEGPLKRELLGDLDAIVLYTLRKEPDDRYKTAEALSDDIRRYLELKPVLARRGTRRYRLGKFVRRHWVSASVAALFLSVLVGGSLLLLGERRATFRERDRAEAVAAFLTDMFKVSRSGRRNGHTITAYEVLENGSVKLADSLPRDKRTRGTLRLALARLYSELGLATPARGLLRPALEDLEASEPKSPEMGRLLFDLARAELAEGRYGEAEKYLESALAHSSTDMPQEETLSLQGELLFARGDSTGAKRLFREVLDHARLAYGEDDHRTATAENNLAAALHQAGRFPEARALYKHSLATREKLYPEESTVRFQSVHNLARLLQDEGRLADAKTLYMEAWNMRRTQGNYDLPSALVVTNSGALLTTLGNFRRRPGAFTKASMSAAGSCPTYTPRSRGP